MEEVLGRLRTLTPVQLRQEILAAGLKCGPVTATTRAIFERKLARSLLERNGGASDGAERGSSAEKEGGAGRDPSLELSLSSEEGKGEKVAAPCGEAEESPSESPPVYYGVCPQQDKSSRTDKVHVFVDRKKALRAMGAMNSARFKAFSTREEAEVFSKGASERSLSSVRTADGPQRTVEPLEVIGTSPPPNSEKANEFHSPRPQDLTAKLRKSVEQGDQEAFTKLVWSNPRYLIGSGDNPTIVHEGCHYNALHVAAKENQAGMAQVLLDTLESPEFMRLMYPEDQEAMLHQRIRYIVDLYLNTPDRTNNDTPLHFACKFGCAEVVNILCSHPTTDKQRRNKYSQKPSSMICERKNKTPEMRRKIKEYLEDRCYVPLLRDTDNSFQPVIGLPWSPSPLEVDPQLWGSGLEGSPIDPVLTVRAYMGPVSPSKAEELYRLWRAPPRERAEYFHRILKSDPDRGAERVGREIAHDMGHPWAEYWDFLGSFVDLSTEEGLNRLEEYLDRKDNSVTPQHNNRLEEYLDRKDNSVTPQHNNRLEEYLDRKDYSVTPQHNNRLEEYLDRKDYSVTPQHNNRLEEYLDRKDKSVTPQHNNSSRNRGTDPAADSPQRSSSQKAEKKSSVSPVCNLLPEFEKASLHDGSLRDQRAEKNPEVCLASSETGPGENGLDLANGSFWKVLGWMQKQGKQKQEQEQEEEELSSCCSEDYLTADEGSDRPGEDGRHRKDSTSSYSSCQTTEDTAEDTTLIPEPSAHQGLFIEGDSPCRLDREVLCAVENIDIDPERFPSVTKWRNTVLAYPSPLRLSWPSPVQKKSSTEILDLSPSRLTSPWHPRSGSILSPGSLSHAQGAYASHILCRALFRSPK